MYRAQFQLCLQLETLIFLLPLAILVYAEILVFDEFEYLVEPL